MATHPTPLCHAVPPAAGTAYKNATAKSRTKILQIICLTPDTATQGTWCKIRCHMSCCLSTSKSSCSPNQTRPNNQQRLKAGLAHVENAAPMWAATHPTVLNLHCHAVMPRCVASTSGMFKHHWHQEWLQRKRHSTNPDVPQAPKAESHHTSWNSKAPCSLTQQGAVVDTAGTTRLCASSTRHLFHSCKLDATPGALGLARANTLFRGEEQPVPLRP